MQRTIVEVPQGQDLVRSTVRIVDDPGDGDGQDGFRALGMFLQTLATMPALMRHANDCPAELAIRHSGTAWVLEATSYVTRKPDAPSAPGPAPAA